MTRIAEAFAKGKRERRAVFIPYLTAGDPNLGETERFVGALVEAGADIVEIGIPFSDPIADGKVNQRAAERALKAGTELSDIIDRLIPQLRAKHPALGIVLFTYFNPLLQMGLDRFAPAAVQAGADGVLVVDLPVEEASEHIAQARRAGLDTIFLAAPTTTPARLERIGKASTGFVYYVSRLGVTGTRQKLSETLADELAEARRRIDKPLAVGFGISTPLQARAVGKLADGVVVGSALVKLIEDAPPPEAAAKMKELAGDIARALKR